MKKVVVVAPTFNEEENISNFLQAVGNYEVVVSDSHSKDKTADIVRKIARTNKKIHYLDTRIPGPGKLGSGIAKGLDYAVEKLGAEILVTMEADLSNDPSKISDFVAKLPGHDLVLGSRYVVGGKIENWSWWRKGLSRIANLLLTILTGASNIHEFTNLYRCFKAETWLKLRPKLANQPGWLFVPDFVFEALDANLKIVEQPITYFDRFGGRSKMNTMNYAKNLLQEAISFRLKKSASFFKFLVVGTLGFVINTIALIIGVQFGMTPANAGSVGAELAIISNFILNNLWTFSDRTVGNMKEIPWKFIQFNFLSLGSAVIQYFSLRIGESIFGLSAYKGPILNAPIVSLISWYMVFYVAGVGLGLIWNYLMYSRVIWAKKKK